jgi:hypothetical protein
MKGKLFLSLNKKGFYMRQNGRSVDGASGFKFH